MVLRIIYNKLKNKKFKILILISFLIYLLLYMCIKNEFFYNASQYTTTYLDYYIKNYLSNVANNLILDNEIVMYIESDVQNIFSALYLYVVSFNNKIFLVYSLLMTIYVFYYISSVFYSEVFNNGVVSNIFRIGERKYLNNTIISNSIYCGLLFLVSKLLYFIFLNIFFPNGISYVHFLGSTSFINDKFLYIAYNCSSIIIIIFDFIMAFLYGAIISLVSLVIVSLIKNKSLSYVAYIFSIAVFSIIPILFYYPPFILYSSIYNYFNYYTNISLELNVYEPLIISAIILISLLFITKFILKRRIRMVI